jgi:hypothetical protein
MCTLQAHMQCYDRFFEVFTSEVEFNELMIENAVSQLLLDFFDQVMVDVNIIFYPHEYTDLLHCSIHIQAQCECKPDSLYPHQKENIELTLENTMCSIFRELFGSVIVDGVTFIPSPTYYRYDYSISNSV